MVLVVMELQGLLRHEGLEGIIVVWQGWQFEGHWTSSFVGSVARSAAVTARPRWGRGKPMDGGEHRPLPDSDNRFTAAMVPSARGAQNPGGALAVERIGLLIGMRGREDAGIVEHPADDLQADRKARGGEAAVDARGRLLGEVEGVGEGRPAEPGIAVIGERRQPPRFEGRHRHRRGQQEIVAGHELPHAAAVVGAGQRRRQIGVEREAGAPPSAMRAEAGIDVVPLPGRQMRGDGMRAGPPQASGTSRSDRRAAGRPPRPRRQARRSAGPPRRPAPRPRDRRASPSRASARRRCACREPRPVEPTSRSRRRVGQGHTSRGRRAGRSRRAAAPHRRTVRAIGPIWASVPNSDSGYAGTRPKLGLRPKVPVKCAGIRIEPPPSVPRASGAKRAASATAEPPDEPPGVIAGFHGLRVMPVSGESVTPFQPNSGVVVLPIRTAPASLQPGHRRRIDLPRAVGDDSARAAPGRPAARQEDVLDRNRHAVERRERRAGRPPGLGGRGLAERRFRVDKAEGVDAGVEPGDAVEKRRGDLDAATARGRRRPPTARPPSSRGSGIDVAALQTISRVT